MSRPRIRRLAVLALGLMLCGTTARADVVVYTVSNSRPAAADHWPGPDGLVGTSDDVVNQNLSPLNGSEWNRLGSFSYNAFDFVGDGSVSEAALLPAGLNAVTFLSGSMSIDTQVAAQGGGPLVVQWDLGGTEPFPGHGAYSSQILAVNGGTYDPSTRAFTLDVDFQALLQGGSANGVNLVLTGEAYVLGPNDFVSGTGNAYVDGVLIPDAQADNNTGLVFLRGTGVVPASSGGSGGSFPSMPIEAVLVGTTRTTPVESPAWSALKGLYRR